MMEVAETKETKRSKKDIKSRVHHFVPRLMDMQTSAEYLSVSYWTVRGLVQSGRIETVEFPRANDAEPIRRVLIDRATLDEFVDGLRRSRRPN
jgi:hypothetical protein